MLALDVSPEVCFTSFAKCGKGLFRNQVDAFYNPSYNRAQDPDLECIIASRWCAALQKNPILHNNSKFRLARVGYSGDHITLKLGTTCCCDFLGTNCLPRKLVQPWEEKGECDFRDKAAYMANPLQLGVLLHTNDDEYVFLRRLFLCCEKRALNDRVVAIPSPEGVDLCSNLSNLLFNSVIDAIEEEVGIPRQCLTDPELIGLLQDRYRSWSPSLEFYVRVANMSKKDIFFRYLRLKNKLRNIPTSSELKFVHWFEMNTINSTFYRNLDAQAKGTLLLYRELNYR